MDNGFFDDIGERYKKVMNSKDGQALYKELIRMQTDKNDKLNPGQAETNAKMCISLCQTWNGIHYGRTDESKEIMHDYANRFDENNKRIVLTSIEYIFKNGAADDAQGGSLKEDISGYLIKNYATDARTTKEIAASIDALIDNMVIPPEVFKTAIANIDHNANYIDAFEKISSADLSMKCIDAMTIFINTGCAMPQAVQQACMQNELHAISEAVNNNWISEAEALEKRKKLMKKVMIFAAVTVAIVVASEVVIPAMAATATTTATATATATAATFAPPVPAVFAEIAGITSAGTATATAGATVGATAATTATAAGAAGAVTNLADIAALPDTNLLKQAIMGRPVSQDTTNVLQAALNKAGNATTVAKQGNQMGSFFNGALFGSSVFAVNGDTIKSLTKGAGRSMGKLARTMMNSKNQESKKQETVEETNVLQEDIALADV